MLHGDREISAIETVVSLASSGRPIETNTEVAAAKGDFQGCQRETCEGWGNVLFQLSRRDGQVRFKVAVEAAGCMDPSCHKLLPLKDGTTISDEVSYIIETDEQAAADPEVRAIDFIDIATDLYTSAITTGERELQRTIRTSEFWEGWEPPTASQGPYPSSPTPRAGLPA